jgi:hypothetical protein
MSERNCGHPRNGQRMCRKQIAKLPLHFDRPKSGLPGGHEPCIIGIRLRRTGHSQPDAPLDARRLNSADSGSGSYEWRFQHRHSNEKPRPRQLGEASGRAFRSWNRMSRRTTVPHLNANEWCWPHCFNQPRVLLRPQSQFSSLRNRSFDSCRTRKVLCRDDAISVPGPDILLFNGRRLDGFVFFFHN